MISWYYSEEFVFASFFTWEKQKRNITSHILNYNGSFFLDVVIISFIIFKRLYNTSFKTNVVYFSRAAPSCPSLNPPTV